MDKFKIDPEISKLIPPLATEELRGLELSIKQEGCRDALVVWCEKGVLLDGHNRYRICKKQGVPFRTTTISFTGSEEAKKWVIRNQLARRNLTDFQRIELARSYEALIAAEKAKAMKARGSAYWFV
jgi:ParB-like chromosome segregation protein Spo0J